ncbi:MAG: DNA recombination protein RmuC [candidate division Zixibacteria bacterium]
MPDTISILIGIGIGLIASYGFRLLMKRRTEQIGMELFKRSESDRKADAEELLKHVESSFGSLSLKALKQANEELVQLAGRTIKSGSEANTKELESKKGLIDQQLQKMTAELEKVAKVTADLGVDRAQKFGELSSELKEAALQRSKLIETTTSLNEALASPQARGQWGERMAEDVLRIAGFIEGINYHKQKAIKETDSRNRPDFTFLLPRDLKLNMDVKFPADNYIRFVESETDIEKKAARKDFLRDVRNHVNGVTTRGYISVEQNTVDYILMLIPNEQIFTFINKEDQSLIDDAIRSKVIICSPITLFAVLAVIRQAVDNFMVERQSNEILSLYGTFDKQWQNFRDKMEKMGKKIGEAQNEFDALNTTRSNMLEKPLNQIDDIRKQRGLKNAATPPEDSPLVTVERDWAPVDDSQDEN